MGNKSEGDCVSWFQTPRVTIVVYLHIDKKIGEQMIARQQHGIRQNNAAMDRGHFGEGWADIPTLVALARLGRPSQPRAWDQAPTVTATVGFWYNWSGLAALLGPWSADSPPPRRRPLARPRLKERPRG